MPYDDFPITHAMLREDATRLTFLRENEATVDFPGDT